MSKDTSTFEATINGHTFTFATHPRCFSPRQVDAGTLAMLSVMALSPADKVLDLGCGYGMVGLYAAQHTAPEHVMMADLCPTSVACARHNAELNGTPGILFAISDGFANISAHNFTVIASNPPYHADFAVPKHFIEKGFQRLAIGGKFYMVTKRRDWYKNKFISVFGGVKIHAIGDYFVFEAEKRPTKKIKD